MRIKNKFSTEGEGHIYFISDLHIGHKNIISFSGRPFENVDEMNKSIIEELQKTKENDIIFNLGDVFWNINSKITKEILTSIPARKFLVLGNHDNRDELKKTGMFEMVEDELEIMIEHKGADYGCTLSHYPMLSWNHKIYGTFMIHGHCHGNLDGVNTASPDLRLDVGVDSDIAHKKGSFLIELGDIIDYFKVKTGGMDFKEWNKEMVKIW